MGRGLIYEVIEVPATTALVAVLCAIWMVIKSRNLGYGSVGLSYDRCIQHKEVWRVVTAQMSHIEALHLLFNLSSTWSLRAAESQGSLRYLHTSVLLMLISAAVYIAFLHLCISVGHQEHYRHLTVVGYSCVVFGWMTILLIKCMIAFLPPMAGGVAKFSVLGLTELPMIAAPIGSLALTSIMFPRASFLGHLSGILVGYLVAIGAFDWLTPAWLLSLLAWTAAAVVWHLLRQGELSLPFVRLQAEEDVESGGLGQIDVDVSP